MIEWKDITSYSRRDKERNPTVLSADIYGITIIVHKYIGYGDAWLLTCRYLKIDKHNLKTTDLKTAKENALDYLKQILYSEIERYTEALKELE